MRHALEAVVESPHPTALRVLSAVASLADRLASTAGFSCPPDHSSLLQELTVKAAKALVASCSCGQLYLQLGAAEFSQALELLADTAVTVSRALTTLVTVSDLEGGEPAAARVGLSSVSTILSIDDTAGLLKVPELVSALLNLSAGCLESLSQEPTTCGSEMSSFVASALDSPRMGDRQAALSAISALCSSPNTAQAAREPLAREVLGCIDLHHPRPRLDLFELARGLEGLGDTAFDLIAGVVHQAVSQALGRPVTDQDESILREVLSGLFSAVSDVSSHRFGSSQAWERVLSLLRYAFALILRRTISI
eukprot:gnl/Dysnectes_brevis/8588_a15379_185.p1 GENE.gnl/Dysnectes_brevis/8588_a15379_185~~gnl/Dysnectes_brevis/8588_a15379_185.p1  ORF type:complete len:350 (+),score=49.12 gnl/Dysnectes_brevis/8588_a15379_185:126-1052(+)